MTQINQQNPNEIIFCESLLILFGACLTTDELALDLNDTHLVRLGRQLDLTQFKTVIANLGMHKTKLEEIEYTYKEHGLLGMKGMALIKWKQARLDAGEKATIKHLSDSIVALDVGNHFICQIFREKSNLLGDGHVHLQKSPTDKVLKELSNHIGNCALELSLELGLGLPKTEHIVRKTSADIPQMIEEILIKWKRKSKQTTARSLMMSLQRIGTGGCSYLRGIMEDSTKFEEVSLSKDMYEKGIDQRGSPFEGNCNIEENYERKIDQQGLALIVNYRVNREGSREDEQRLKTYFKDTLGYHVKCKHDLNKSNLMKTINAIKTDDMMGKAGMQYHCFVFVIMCHGKKDTLSLSGGDCTTVKEIVDKFKFTDFAGKPKFFIFQACREGLHQSFGHATDNADASSQVYDDAELHQDSNILISFATTPGNIAYRKIPHADNIWIGSWFVHALLDVFEKQYKQKDVMKMLEKVRRNLNENKEYRLTDGKCQMSEDVSTLSKTFFL